MIGRLYPFVSFSSSLVGRQLLPFDSDDRWALHLRSSGGHGLWSWHPHIAINDHS